MIRFKFTLIIVQIGIFYISGLLNCFDIWILSLPIYVIMASVAHFGWITSSAYRSYVVFADPKRPLWITSISVPFFSLEILFNGFYCSQSVSLLIGTRLKFFDNLALTTSIGWKLTVKTNAHRIHLRFQIIVLADQISVPMLINQTLTYLFYCWTRLWWLKVFLELSIQVVLNGLLYMRLPLIIVVISIRWFVAV